MCVCACVCMCVCACVCACVCVCVCVCVCACVCKGQEGRGENIGLVLKIFLEDVTKNFVAQFFFKLRASKSEHTVVSS